MIAISKLANRHNAIKWSSKGEHITLVVVAFEIFLYSKRLCVSNVNS